MQGWQIPRGRWEKCVFMLGSGITASVWKGSGDQAVHPWVPAVLPEDNSSPDAWDGCPDAFLAGTSSRPGCPLPALWQLGRGGCGRAGIAFLCHRKQLPGVSQAGSGLPASLGQPELLSQPAGGRGSCVQTLCRNGSVTWNISGFSLGQGLSPALVPCHQPAENQLFSTT